MIPGIKGSLLAAVSLALVGCADGRLLAAKRAGRNRVTAIGHYESERTLPNQAARSGAPA